MTILIPTATYTSPSEPNTVELTPGDGPHSTDGRTTQISDVVLKAGGEDRDRPSPAKGTPAGNLRAQLTTLQDQLNDFLTLRMQSSKKVEDDDLEKRILDDGVEEDSD